MVLLICTSCLCAGVTNEINAADLIFIESAASVSAGFAAAFGMAWLGWYVADKTFNGATAQETFYFSLFYNVTYIVICPTTVYIFGEYYKQNGSYWLTLVASFLGYGLPWMIGGISEKAGGFGDIRYNLLLTAASMGLSTALSVISYNTFRDKYRVSMIAPYIQITTEKIAFGGILKL